MKCFAYKKLLPAPTWECLPSTPPRPNKLNHCSSRSPHRRRFLKLPDFSRVRRKQYQFKIVGIFNRNFKFLQSSIGDNRKHSGFRFQTQIGGIRKPHLRNFFRRSGELFEICVGQIVFPLVAAVTKQAVSKRKIRKFGFGICTDNSPFGFQKFRKAKKCGWSVKSGLIIKLILL